MEKKWTGERLETFIHSRDTIDHLNRYAYALNYIKTDQIVLDIACGEGYGSNLMSKRASQVIGVDIDEETIQNAKKKYKSENLSFSVGSADNIQLEDNSVDVVVSFETIEHHDRHSEMIHEIKRVLKPDGIMIISTPDKYYYSDVRNFKNKFHVKELYRDQFENLISKAFTNIKLLNQVYINQNSFICSDQIFNLLSVYNGEYNQICVEEKIPLYLIAVASDANISILDFVFFNGSQIAKKTNDDFYKRLYRNSYSFKVGSFVLYPLKALKKIISKV